MVEGLAGPVRPIIDKASSLEEVRDRLLDAYQGMDVSGLASPMQRALAAADLAGRDDAPEEMGAQEEE